MQNVLSKSEQFKSEYCCSVCKIQELTPVEGSDFLAKTNVFNTQIVVRKDQIHVGDILFYAANETALNSKFLSLNNLYEISCRDMNSNSDEVNSIMKEYDDNYRNKANELKAKAKQVKSTITSLTNAANRLNRKLKKEENEEEKVKLQISIDEKTQKAMSKTVEYTNLKSQIEELNKAGAPIVEKAKKLVGFMNKYGRVRCITLKGEPSFGFLFGVEEMAKFAPNIKDINLEEYLNEDFDTVNGELFVKAFVPPIKEVRHSGSKGAKRNKKLSRFDRLVEGEFAFHYDSTPLQKVIQLIRPDDNVVISKKLHGCVEYNTIVNTKEYGNLKIGDVVTNKIDCHILARDLKINKDVYVPIDDYYTIPNDGEWYEIELDDGTEITITGNNPVWLPRENAYRRVDELKGNEYFLLTV